MTDLQPDQYELIDQFDDPDDDSPTDNWEQELEGEEV